MKTPIFDAVGHEVPPPGGDPAAGLAHAIYDTFNTSRLSEQSQETQDAYMGHGKTALEWLRVLGYDVVNTRHRRVPPPAGIDREALVAEVLALWARGKCADCGRLNPEHGCTAGDEECRGRGCNWAPLEDKDRVEALLRAGHLTVAPPAPAIPRQDEAELREEIARAMADDAARKGRPGYPGWDYIEHEERELWRAVSDAILPLILNRLAARDAKLSELTAERDEARREREAIRTARREECEGLRAQLRGMMIAQSEARLTVTDEKVERAAKVLWTDRDACMGGPWEEQEPNAVCVIQTKATARAALTAAMETPR